MSIFVCDFLDLSRILSVYIECIFVLRVSITSCTINLNLNLVIVLSTASSPSQYVQIPVRGRAELNVQVAIHQR